MNIFISSIFSMSDPVKEALDLYAFPEPADVEKMEAIEDMAKWLEEVDKIDLFDSFIIYLGQIFYLLHDYHDEYIAGDSSFCFADFDVKESNVDEIIQLFEQENEYVEVVKMAKAFNEILYNTDLQNRYRIFAHLILSTKKDFKEKKRLCLLRGLLQDPSAAAKRIKFDD